MSMDLYSVLVATHNKKYNNFNAKCLNKIDNNYTKDTVIDHELTI